MPSTNGSSSTKRLKRSIDFSGGWKVNIKLISRDELTKMNDEYVPGCWDVDTMTVYIDRAISFQRKLETLFHELQHAIPDIELRCRGGI